LQNNEIYLERARNALSHKYIHTISFCVIKIAENRKFGRSSFAKTLVSRLFSAIQSIRSLLYPVIAAIAIAEMAASATLRRSESERERQVVPREEVIRFIRECMRKAGTTSDDAFTVAHHLMISDYRGHFSHGMSRMKRYVTDIKNRLTDPTAQPLIVADFQVRTASSCLICKSC
jgi:hypothetical protein